MMPNFDLSLIAVFLQQLILLIPAVSVHEYAHALAADILGDKTSRYAGRLTLNPVAHIDPMWTILLPLVLFVSTGGMFVFGSAKPVPIDYSRLRNPKRDIIWIGIAGPLANFCLAFVCFLLVKFFPGGLAGSLLATLGGINVFLGVFNLLPVPPLDGSRVVAGILPDSLSAAYLKLEPYGMVILVALLWFNVVTMFVLPLASAIIRLFLSI